MADDNAYEKALLWAGIEGFPALWELRGELQGLGLDEEAAQAETARLARRLLQDGLLVIGVRRGDAQERRPLPLTAALPLLDDPEQWRVPKWTEDVLCVETSPAGEQRYRSLFA